MGFTVVLLQFTVVLLQFSHVTAVYSHVTAVYSRVPAVYSRVIAVYSCVPAVYSHGIAVYSHVPAVYSHVTAVYSCVPAVSVSWDVTCPYASPGILKDHGVIKFRVQPSKDILLKPDEEASTILQNVGCSLPNDTASYPRRLESLTCSTLCTFVSVTQSASHTSHTS